MAKKSSNPGAELARQRWANATAEERAANVARLKAARKKISKKSKRASDAKRAAALKAYWDSPAGQARRKRSRASRANHD